MALTRSFPDVWRGVERTRLSLLFSCARPATFSNLFHVPVQLTSPRRVGKVQAAYHYPGHILHPRTQHRPRVACPQCQGRDSLSRRRGELTTLSWISCPSTCVVRSHSNSLSPQDEDKKAQVAEATFKVRRHDILFLRGQTDSGHCIVPFDDLAIPPASDSRIVSNTVPGSFRQWSGSRNVLQAQNPSVHADRGSLA